MLNSKSIFIFLYKNNVYVYEEVLVSTTLRVTSNKYAHKI